MEQRKHSYIAGACANVYSHFEVCVVVFQKNGNKITMTPSYSALGNIPKECSFIPQGHLFIIFIAVLSVITNTWTKFRYPSPKEEIKKIWYIDTMQYYSKVKNKDTRKFEGKWTRKKTSSVW